MSEAEEKYLAERVQMYIEEHITEPITLKNLADDVSYSPWYLAKVFKKATGKAPYDYIKARRLTLAALDLRDGQKKVIDVALDFVFDSQEGFTRAFSKEFGITPARYRRETPAIRLFFPEKCYHVYKQLEHIRRANWAQLEKSADKVTGDADCKRAKQRNGSLGSEICNTAENGVYGDAGSEDGGTEKRMSMSTKTVFCQVIERPERKCIVKRGVAAEEYFEYCNEVGCDVWDTLCSVKEALYEPIGMWLPKKLTPAGTSKYIQGVEVPMCYDKPVPEGYELITLEPCMMMVFQGEPYDDEFFGEAIGEVWDHIEKFKPEVYGYAWAPEEAPRFQLVPQGYRGYIEARPIRKL